MANILGLVGSPRKAQGLTERLVSATLEGAEDAGASTQIEYLENWGLDYCRDCGSPCFEDGICTLSESVTELNRRVNAADGVVIGAPVYLWHINALTHQFMDRYRIPGGASLARKPNGRPALAIIVAGGTGTGISGAVRSLLDFFAIWGYRALDPVRVTRYRLEEAVEEAGRAGALLAKTAEHPVPFSGLPELLSYYDALEAICQNHLDEFIWLAGQAKHLGLAERSRLEELIAEAKELRLDNPLTAAEKAVLAFELARGQL